MTGVRHKQYSVIRSVLEQALKLVVADASAGWVFLRWNSGEDFLCASTPGDGYLYNVDSFAMFAVDGDDKVDGQMLLASLIMGENFQSVFNLNKGSIPARVDVSLDEFDSCALTSSADMASTSEGGSLLPSYAHGMALRGAQAGAITDVVTAHFNSDMSSAEAVEQLVAAVANSM